jgi:aminomethyltransferase
VSSSPLRTVPLDEVHRALGATMTPFGGWDMPVRYGSDLAEHQAVRERAGLFDVSHMGRVEIAGSTAGAALDAALVSRIDDLEVGRCRYTMMCDDAGGVIDDLIVTRLDGRFLLIVNAANTGVALAALREACDASGAELIHREGHVLLALQGPAAAAVLASASARDVADGAADATLLRPFRAVATRVAGIATIVARTGYTGEDGFELACDGPTAGRKLWDMLLTAGAASGIRPCGLAARDTLRLEAGLPLHGHELGPELGPFEAGLSRVVHLDEDRGFRGRAALERVVAEGPARRVVGLMAEGRRAPRAGSTVLDGARPVGIITSGAPSPTLGVPIALASLDVSVADPGTALQVDVRGTTVEARVVALPFVLPAARRADRPTGDR